MLEAEAPDLPEDTGQDTPKRYKRRDRKGRTNNYYAIDWLYWPPNTKNPHAHYTEETLAQALMLTPEDIQTFKRNGMRERSAKYHKRFTMRDVIAHLLDMQNIYYANREKDIEEGGLLGDLTPESESIRITALRKAQRETLEYEIENKDVYRAKEVFDDLLPLLSEVRSRFLAVENLAPELEGKTALEIRKSLKAELRRTCNELADVIEGIS